MPFSPRVRPPGDKPPGRVSPTAIVVWVFVVVEAIGIGWVLSTY
jgi:hypothetical protein